MNQFSGLGMNLGNLSRLSHARSRSSRDVSPAFPLLLFHRILRTQPGVIHNLWNPK